MKQSRVWAEIDLDRVTHNLDVVRAHAGPNCRIMAIVKANAYGHGAVPVAWHLASRGVHAVGVGDSQEAIELRLAGLSIPILILGAVIHGELPDVVAHDIAVTVHSAERVRTLDREARRAVRQVAVHLKVDTGMGRLGCRPESAPELIELIHASEHLRLEGLCTHFSSAGREGDDFTRLQIERFEAVTDRIRRAGWPVPARHAEASGAILGGVAGQFDFVRPGIALFGLSPRPGTGSELKPALSLKSQVIFLKDFEEGAPIGYGRTHITSGRTRIATLPVGYNDGYAFRLGGRADVLIRGVRAPVVGRVSMDYLTVDVGHVPGVSVGDEVVLMGHQGAECVTAEELADLSGTIPYEVLTRLGKRVVRVYRGGGKPAGAPSTEHAGSRLADRAEDRGFSVLRRPTLPDTPKTGR